MLYRFVVGLLQPFTLLYLLALIGVVNLWRRRREGRRRLLLLTAPFAALTVVCTPAVSYLALGSLEWLYPPLDRRPSDAEVIVVFSGGIIAPDRVRGRAELSASSLYRCLHAAEVYRDGGRLPVIVSGGKVDPTSPGPTEARALKELIVGLGVDPADVIEEDRSRTTFENAAECAKILRQKGLRRVVLVTEASHMLRSMRAFRKQGFEPVPSGCHYRATEFHYSLFDFLPGASAAVNFQAAFHEWLGAAWYRLHGRI